MTKLSTTHLERFVVRSPRPGSVQVHPDRNRLYSLASECFSRQYIIIHTYTEQNVLRNSPTELDMICMQTDACYTHGISGWSDLRKPPD